MKDGIYTDINTFVEELGEVKLPNVFNPYAEVDERYDREIAHNIRSWNVMHIIRCMLEHRETDDYPIDMWIGREPGYRGCRRTGVAFTDEMTLSVYLVFSGCDGQHSSCKFSAVNERTAQVVVPMITRVIAEKKRLVFTWNVFPFHSHEEGNPDSNRAHNAKEREIGMRFLRKLVDILEPERMVAIGTDAKIAINSIETKAGRHYVRHPSYGGNIVFEQQIERLYELEKTGLDV